MALAVPVFEGEKTALFIVSNVCTHHGKASPKICCSSECLMNEEAFTEPFRDLKCLKWQHED